MSFTLSPRGQLIAGLMAALYGPLTGLVKPSNIRAGWVDINMAADLAAQPNTPIVIIDIGPSKPSKDVPGGNAGGNDTAYASTNNTINPDGSLTTLRETLREDVPVRFIVQCNGLDGARLRDAVANAIVTTLGRARWLPLPDSLEAIPSSTPWLAQVQGTYYNIRAKLVYNGTKPVDNNNDRQEYRYDVVYTATYANFSVQTDPVVTKTVTTVLLTN